jgi:hypothetical protein
LEAFRGRSRSSRQARERAVSAGAAGSSRWELALRTVRSCRPVTGEGRTGEGRAARQECQRWEVCIHAEALAVEQSRKLVSGHVMYAQR